VEIVGDRLDGFLVALLDGQFEHIPGLVEPGLQGLERPDDVVESRALAAQFLGPRRVVPDLRVFQFPAYFFQPVALARIVKGTP